MKRTVLIVEDYDDTRFCMNLILESYGYQVIEASNGLEAIESLKDNFPDLILMDISMPVMDGITATKTIRKSKQGGEIPILAVTAHGKKFFEEAMDAGCNDLIEKPVDFDSLKSVLNQYLKS